MRQLERCKSALPETWVVTCHFYDVESGRLGLEARGRKVDYERFDIPIARDGGISDLLAEAGQPGRRFDVVICESTSRVARGMFENLSIERTLEKAGVPLFAWNEPIKLDGGRSQQILQRRINQSVAEYEVYNALETSWGGLCTHIREGWNIGKPPYGYRAKRYRNPNPIKADKGFMKSRLEPDGVRAETVTQIAIWSYYERLGYGIIAERLNSDRDRYPPPDPPGGVRARGAWGKSTVGEILRNPKYTGYQVFNRRASRSRSGKVNNPELWIWSPYPVHEPLIPKWMFDELDARRRTRLGLQGISAQGRPPSTHHTYTFRGRVLCACGRRLHGNRRKGITYYTCWPRANNRGRPDTYAQHPKGRYVSEATLLRAVVALYADRVLASHMRYLLAADLAAIVSGGLRQHEEERAGHERVLADIIRRQEITLQRAQECALDDPFGQCLRKAYNDLEEQRQSTISILNDLNAETANRTTAAGAGITDLLESLPHLALNLASAPQQLLLKLFELTELSAQLPEAGDNFVLSVALPADYTPGIALRSDGAQGAT
ncbi:recombinase family protein [Streptomyces sp. NPDC048506]|uniref:recombinase family protein n=1 Tax=Streptomyces sp. NPDC048506 TaxID=3155028 RepID=UPI0034223A1F